jgi:tryptophan synthase alpha chain
MNKIDRLFQNKKNNILSIYFTAGFPKLTDTVTILHELQSNGVDMIEVGMPFSDPLADGPTIQHTSEVALGNGMSIKMLFEQLADAGIKDSSAAILLMGYLNPVLQYGIEQFCKDAAALGVDGVIVPDLPMQEYLDEYKPVFEKYKLKNVFLITPQTSESRVRFIDDHTDGFIYMVSSSSTTGAKGEILDAQETYFKRVRSMNLKNPTLIGFGISDGKTFEKACEYASGAIIGSAFVKALTGSSNLKKDIGNFVKGIQVPAKI